MTHLPEHEARLEELLGSAVDPREALVGTELEGCATCAAQLEELLSTAGRLDALRAFERDELERAAGDSALGEDAVLDAVRAEILGEADRAPAEATGPSSLPAPSSGPWAAWRLAAAAVLLAGLTLWLLRPEPDTPYDPGQLLGGELELLAPVGEADGFERFRWKGELEDGDYFVVRVIDADGATFESPRVTEAEWTPEDSSVFADTIQWTVERYGTNPREPLASASATASR